HHEGRTPPQRRKGEIPPRHAAGDLDVDHPVANLVAGDDLSQDDTERRTAHRPGDGKLAERSPEPVEVARLVDEAPAEHLANLVDAVAELVAAVLHVDAGIGERVIAAVHIGDTAHAPIPSDFSLRWR